MYCLVRNGTIQHIFCLPVLDNKTVQGKNPVPYQNRETKNPYRRSLAVNNLWFQVSHPDQPGSRGSGVPQVGTREELRRGEVGRAVADREDVPAEGADLQRDAEPEVETSSAAEITSIQVR